MTPFAKKVLNWFEEHGRHDLPWQENPTAYRVWVSEIMLQQTQVATVIPYFQKFQQRFPTVHDLASAESDQVLHQWTGLGYYARARNLHKAAKQIVRDYDGEFPCKVEELESLPGIGRSTAGAIAALSMGVQATILDGNVKRVLTRFHAVEGYPERSDVKKKLWEIAELDTPKERVSDYTQAMMDLGATVCTRSKPDCTNCPLASECQALEQDKITSYPGKKPKKKLPIRRVSMFILQNPAGEVLLEKRAPSGIWGSLYSLPEGSDSRDRPTLEHVEILGESEQAMPALRHSFSHYHLDISPVRLSAQQKSARIADSDRWLWYPLDHSLEVGLAAPVKKLLSQLATESTIEETP